MGKLLLLEGYVLKVHCRTAFIHSSLPAASNEVFVVDDPCHGSCHAPQPRFCREVVDGADSPVWRFGVAGPTSHQFGRTLILFDILDAPSFIVARLNFARAPLDRLYMLHQSARTTCVHPPTHVPYSTNILRGESMKQLGAEKLRSEDDVAARSCMPEAWSRSLEVVTFCP